MTTGPPMVSPNGAKISVPSEMSLPSATIAPTEETLPSPLPPPAMVTYSSSFDTVTVAILSGLLVFLSVLVIVIVTKILTDRLRDMSNTNGSSSDQTDDHNTHSKDTEERIVRRYETVEHWLVTKRVQKHDDFCARVVNGIIPQSPVGATLGDLEEGGAAATATATVAVSPGGIENPTDTDTADDAESGANATTTATATITCGTCKLQSTSHTTDGDSLFDDDEKECPICMNDLRQGDIVSWSASEKCQHVYHHECIKEWLLRRTGCPFCRETFLPCDEIRGDKKTEELKEMSKRYASRSSTTYYCIQEGLVALPPMVRCTLKELDQLKSRIFDSSIKPEDLVTLRGERKDATVTAVGKDTDDDVAGLMVEDPSENPCFEEQDDYLVEYSPDRVIARVTLSGATTTTTTTSTNANQNNVTESPTLGIRHGTPEEADDDEEESSSLAVIEAFGGDIPGDDDLEDNDDVEVVTAHFSDSEQAK